MNESVAASGKIRENIQVTIKEWLHRKNGMKREVLSLVGTLQHAAKVIRPGRTFVYQIYSTAAKVQELEYFTCLNKEFQSRPVLVAYVLGSVERCYFPPAKKYSRCYGTDRCLWFVVLHSLLYGSMATIGVASRMGQPIHNGKRASPYCP